MRSARVIAGSERAVASASARCSSSCGSAAASIAQPGRPPESRASSCARSASTPRAQRARPRSPPAATRRNSTRAQRERIVSSRRSSFAAMSTKTTCGGGSSSVFRKAFCAPSDSASAGSMMTTRVRPSYGFERDGLLDVPHLFDADRLARGALGVGFDRHRLDVGVDAGLDAAAGLHSPQGGSSPVQFSACARRFAAVARPVPSGPTKRYAWSRRRWRGRPAARAPRARCRSCPSRHRPSSGSSGSA